MTIIHLPMPPTSNNLFATEMASGRRFKTAQYSAWLKHAGYLLNLQRIKPIKERVDILIEVSDAETTDASDLDNRTKATLDLLVAHKIIQGDSKPYVRRVTMAWGNNEGVKVTIAPISSTDD